MKLTHYPSMTHIVNEYKKIGGNQVGIIPGNFISVTEFPGEPYIRTMTASMPAYHKQVFNDPQMDMQYHLSGYGLYQEEALIKLMGESVERYGALVSMKTFEDQIHYATYSELSRSGRCLPLDYLGIFDSEQQQSISSLMPRYSERPPDEHDVIGWIKCPSLVHPGEEIWTPAQLFFLGFQSDPNHNDRMFTPSFSTGTAAHISTTKALRNALIESIQIDAFILNWYTDARAPRVVLDDVRLERFFEQMGLGPEGHYEILATYLTRPELPLPNFGVYLLRKDDRIPFISFGVQADPNPRHAVLRGTQESIAILGMGMYGSVFDTEQFHFANVASAFTDLDTNVQYYANPDNGAIKLATIESRVDGEVQFSDLESLPDEDDASVRELISMIAKVSEWAVYLDITPSELHHMDWRVMRTLIPELCSMCLPGMPPRNHPRFAAYGGVTNAKPHPLP